VKKLILIFLFLTLTSCATTLEQVENNEVRIGMNKEDFCLAVYSINPKKWPCSSGAFGSSKTAGAYYPDNKTEIMHDGYKEYFFVFENVSIPFNYSNWDEGDGILVKIFKNLEEAENFASTVSISEVKQNSTNSESSEWIFTGEKTFGTKPKKKKIDKRVEMYMAYPDKNLCIGYLNNYGVLFKKAKQEARAEVIKIRGLDCSIYRDEAFYDKQRRKTEIADAMQKALDENAESKRSIAESMNKSKGQSQRCTYRKVGSYVRKTCY